MAIFSLNFHNNIFMVSNYVRMSIIRFPVEKSESAKNIFFLLSTATSITDRKLNMDFNSEECKCV